MHSGARQQLQGAALVGSSNGNLPLLIARAMVYIGSIKPCCCKWGNFVFVFTLFTSPAPLSISFTAIGTRSILQFVLKL